MFLLPLLRDQLLAFLPKGGAVAEIGVAEGTFSAAILQAAAPRRLHLIDPWEHQDSASYAPDPNNVTQDENEARYQGVRARFRAEIERGQVVVHREFSGQLAPRFADGELDWVYLDGLHTFEGVTADLESYAPKVRKDGLILGHDYAAHEAARQMQFGVVEAVDDFVRRSDYRFIALTNEAYPTYVLCRSDQATRQLLVESLLVRVRGIAEIDGFPGRRFQHRLVFQNGVPLRYADGTFQHLMSFG